MRGVVLSLGVGRGGVVEVVEKIVTESDEELGFL